MPGNQRSSAPAGSRTPSPSRPDGTAFVRCKLIASRAAHRHSPPPCSVPRVCGRRIAGEPARGPVVHAATSAARGLCDRATPAAVRRHRSGRPAPVSDMKRRPRSGRRCGFGQWNRVALYLRGHSIKAGASKRWWRAVSRRRPSLAGVEQSGRSGESSEPTKMVANSARNETVVRPRTWPSVRRFGASFIAAGVPPDRRDAGERSLSIGVIMVPSAFHAAFARQRVTILRRPAGVGPLQFAGRKRDLPPGDQKGRFLSKPGMGRARSSMTPRPGAASVGNIDLRPATRCSGGKSTAVKPCRPAASGRSGPAAVTRAALRAGVRPRTAR